MERLTIEEVKKRAKEIGVCEVLDDVYMNSKTKLNCKCIEKGHHYKVTGSNIQQKSGCPKCSAIRISEKQRLDIKFIRSEFAKEGYILLTKIYNNNRQKLEYICPNGHRHNIAWTDWSKKVRCPYCAGNAKLTIEFIRAEFAKEGYILLTKIYENVFQKLDYICPKGHKHNIIWNNWQQGQRCFYCSGIKKGRKLRYTIDFIRTKFEKEGYTLLTTVYENSLQRLEYICPKGHEGTIRWGNWQQGQRCPFCSGNGISKWELVVKKFVDFLNISYIPNDRTQIVNPNTSHFLELDIWMPKLNKAIECNGLYWHSKSDRRECDKIKKQLCKDQNIDLLVITDKEWNKDIDKCKTKIKNFVAGE